MEFIDFGVCRLSVVSLRKEPNWDSAIVSQLLFGEHYSVIGKNKSGWLHILLAIDGLEGWIPLLQHHSISEEYFDQLTISDFKITTDITSSILFRKSPLTIVLGSIVPFSIAELFKIEEQLAFNGGAKSLSQRRDGEFVLSIAQKYLNTPEMNGGKTPFGIDTLGFIRMCFRIAGYQLGMNLLKIQKEGMAVELKVVQTGDIVFFNSLKNIHAGIAVSPGRIIHCNGQVRIDSFDGERIFLGPGLPLEFKVVEVRRVIR